jgi:hypothetical protein
MTILRRFTLTALLMTITGAGIQASEPNGDTVTIDVKHRVGEVGHLRTVSKSFGSIKMMETAPAQPFSQTFTQEMRMECKKLFEDGSALYEVQLSRVAMDMNSMGMVVSYDSAKPVSDESDVPPAAGAISAIFGAMTDGQFEIEFGPDLRPKAIRGYKEMIRAMMEQLGDSPEMAAAKPVLKQMESFFDDENMKLMVASQSRGFPPGGKARIGDTWEDHWDMKFGMLNMSMIYHATYTMADVVEHRGRRCAKVTYTSTIDSGAKPGADATEPPKNLTESFMRRMETRMIGSELEGEVYWDLSNGDMLDQTEVGKYEMVIEMKPDPDQPGPAGTGFKMTHSFNTAVTTTLLDDPRETPATQPAAQSPR